MIDQGVKMEALINTATVSLENSVHCVLSLPWLTLSAPHLNTFGTKTRQKCAASTPTPISADIPRPFFLSIVRGQP